MIYPVVLCGGSGTRLWPLSRKSFPKQFSKIIGDETLFQSTCKRFRGANFAAPTIVTNDRFRFTVLDELSDIDIEARRIILEPSAKNTAPAVLAALLDIAASDDQATVLVLPSDHSIVDVEAFRRGVELADSKMNDSQIVTFGIKPSHAETGYGYLELDAVKFEFEQFYKLRRFVEKPDTQEAEKMLAAGNFLWNGGIFMAKAAHLLQQYQTLEPKNWEAIGQAMAGAQMDLGFTRPDQASWDQSEDISIDYAIMEKAEDLGVVPLDMGWSDLGDWKAVWGVADKDDDGVAQIGNVHAVECSNSLLRSEKDNLTVIGLGLDNIFAIAMNDAVLVGDMSKSQEVKGVVELLKSEGKKQAEEFPRDHRPWGWYETLVLGDRFQVKRIVVKPGAALSLQSHVHRSEHWTVVEGSARVTVDDEVKLLGENMSVYIPLGAVHRMENPGRIPLTLIEVQSGPYLGEDDIVRYEDQFGRS